MSENQYDAPHQISRRGPGEVTLGPETAPPFLFSYFPYFHYFFFEKRRTFSFSHLVHFLCHFSPLFLLGNVATFSLLEALTS